MTGYSLPCAASRARVWPLQGALFTLALLLIGGLTLANAGMFLRRDDAVQAADAIVVLAGEGRDFHRTSQALRLYRQGLAPAVVFSYGLGIRPDGTVYSGTPRALAMARAHGLPATATLVSDGAYNTYGEALALQTLTRERGWQRVIVVTSDYHTYRAGRTFASLLPDVTVQVSAAAPPGYDARRYWQSEHGIRAVASEVVKIAFYWWCYGVPPLG